MHLGLLFFFSKKYYTSSSKMMGNPIPPLLAQTFAEQIMAYGFRSLRRGTGELIAFSLTKANAMSPALKRTHQQLCALMSKPVYTQAPRVI